MWSTFKGLCFEHPASPTSSKRTTGKMSLLHLAYLRAFSNTFSILSEVDDSELWYETTYTCGSVLKKSSVESRPRRLFLMIRIDKDLLHPGLPTTNTGIRFKIHTRITNTFSRKELLLHVPCGRSILFRKFSSIIRTTALNIRHETCRYFAISSQYLLRNSVVDSLYK